MSNTSNTIGSILAIIIGILLASVTLIGLIHSQVDAPGSSPVSVERPLIDYGTN
jgi:hypothetical protein